MMTELEGSSVLLSRTG